MPTACREARASRVPCRSILPGCIHSLARGTPRRVDHLQPAPPWFHGVWKTQTILLSCELRFRAVSTATEFHRTEGRKGQEGSMPPAIATPGQGTVWASELTPGRIRRTSLGIFSTYRSCAQPGL